MSILLETLSLPYDGSTVTTDLVTELNVEYEFVVSGVVKWGTASYANHDAFWVERTSGWEQGTPIHIDGIAPDLQAFNENHTYMVPFTGTGNQIDFKMLDSNYSDNSGDLTFDIYQLYPSGSPDHTECDCESGSHTCADGAEGSNPISLQGGEKRERIIDMGLTTPAGILAFTRSYRQNQQSDPATNTIVGAGWSHNHNSFIDASVSSILRIYTQGGGYSEFAEDATNPDLYTGKPGSTARITVNTASSNERYTLESTDQTFIYNDSGKLTKRQWSNSEEWIYSYHSSGYADGLLEKVADGYGRELRFTYIDNSSGFDDLQLWRVGDQTASGLDGASPGGRYVEFSYVENKIEDPNNPGTAINGGEPLLESVTDVRGYTWEYEYEQTDIASLNFLYRYLSPSVDSDGDGVANSAITIKELDYTLSGGAIQSINQKMAKQGSGIFLLEEDYTFQVNGEDKTTVEVANRITTHSFDYGILVQSEDPDGNDQSQAHAASYRPLEQVDANGNTASMDWQPGGKLLDSITDALDNKTFFSYDSQDRLIASTDAEGRVTNYIYEGSRRQPSQILIAADVATELAVNGDMEANSDWSNVGTPTTSQQSTVEASDGQNSWYVDGDTAGEGIESGVAISFAANKTYLISARVYVVNSGETVKMAIENDSNWDVTSSEDGQWETLRAIYTPGSVLTEKLQFLADGAAAQFYVDSVHVIELTGLERWQQFVYDNKGRTLEDYLLNHEDATALQSTVRAYGTSGNGNGLLTNIEIKDLLDSSNNNSTVFDYDAGGRVIRTNKTSMFGTCQYNHMVYDEAGNVLGTACGLVTANPIPSTVTALLALYDVNDESKKHSRITSHIYDEMGRRVETTGNDGTTFARTSRTIYDALGRVVRSIQNYVVQASAAPGDWIWDETNEEWQYSATVSTAVSHGSELDENIIADTDYNGRGLVYRRRDLIGRVTLYGYNNADRLVKTVQNAATADYDMSAYVASNTVDEDIITETVYDPNGNVIKSIDARGGINYTIYDALNRPIKVISNASRDLADATILADLDFANYGNYSIDPDKDMVSTTEYDAMGRVIRSQRLLENRGASEIWDTMLYGYDVLGRQVRTIQHASVPDYDMSADSDLDAYTLSTDSDVDMLTETLYDVQGRVKETIDVNDRVTRMVYDGLNRQVMTIANYVAQATAPETWEWDDTAGRWEDGSNTAIDHGTDKDQNIISQTVYDSDGRVESSRNVEGLVSRNAYDLAGRSLLRIQNFVDNSYVDPAGTLTKEPWHWDSVDGRWEDGDATAIARATNYDQNLISKPDYDDEHRVFQSRDARGNLNRQVYDEAGRQVMSIANYVEQGNPVVDPENWVWSSGNSRWENGSAVAIEHGTNKDQNRISTTEYDLLGRGYRSRDVAGRETYTVYDAVGRVIRRVQNYVVQGTSIPDDWQWTNEQWQDGAGNAITFGTDKDRNIISETSYNQAGQVLSSRDVFGTQSSFAYDSAGRRLQVTQASNTGLATSSYTCFDKAGRVLRSIANYVPHYYEAQNEISADEWDDNENWIFHPEAYIARERNIISEMSYDRASRRVISINPVGDSVTTAYFKDGLVDNISDPEGMKTVYRYDALRRRKLVVQSYRNNNDEYTAPETWSWNGSAWQDTAATPVVITHGTNKDENIIVMLTYDIAGRMLSMRDPRGNLTTYDYDKLGRRTKLTNPLNLDWETSYAEVNGAQQTTMNYPGVNVTGPNNDYDVVRDFDRFGRLLQMDYNDSANTPKVNFGYDLSGNREKMTENNGTSDVRITDYSYDGLNRLTQVDFDRDGDATVEETVNYEYDIRGLRTKLTMPGNLEIVYSYDEKGRLIALDDWDNQQSRFAYDELNRHVATMRPNGMRSRYILDGAGRLRELRHENSQRETLAAFRYAVDGRGNRTRAQELLLEPSASLATDSIQHTDSEVVYTNTWTNNAGFHETTQWDARMALLFVGDKDVELVIGEGSDHSIFDIYIDGTLYESVDGYAATSASRTVNISVRGDGFHTLELRSRHEQNLQSNGYKLRFQSLSVDSKLTHDVIDYSYDELSRLIEADYNNGTTVYDYGYDVAGNMIDMNGVTRTYNVANQMTNDGTNNLTYDNNGNLKNDGTNSYTWDRANRLTDVGNHQYVYDGLSNRVQQTVSSVVTDYLNDVQPGLTKLLKQDDGTNVERFVHAVRGIHAVDDGTDWNYYAQDGLGSVRAMVDDDSAVVQSSMGYDPYGNPMGAYGEGFGFTGEQTDADGSVFLRARYYEPVLGVFSALDPWEGLADEPMSVNGYSWVEGNPVMFTDPSGLCPDNPGFWNLTGRHCREIARNLSEKHNIPFEELVQLPYGELLKIQATGTLNNASSFLSQQASYIPIIPTLFYQNPQAAWQATMQVLSGCGSGATAPALGVAATGGGGQALAHAGGQASSKTPIGASVLVLSAVTLAVIVGGATLKGHFDRSRSQDRSRSEATVVPIPRLGEATPGATQQSTPTPTPTATSTATPDCHTQEMQGGTTSGWVTDQGSHKYGQYVGAIPAIFSTRLAECRPSSVLTLATIAIDGPFLHGRDDSIFQNFGASLPVSSNIQYREYTVDTVGLRRRGQRRIVTAGSPNRQPSGFSSIYYTDDHYATFFFVI